MLKFTLTLIQYVIGIYWIGAAARQNPKVDIFIAQLEGKYGDFNRRLTELPVLQGLQILQKGYGWAAVASGLLFMATAFVRGGPGLQTLCSVAFLASFLGWFSIKWCTRHKAAIAEYLPQTLLILASPLIFVLIESFTGEPLIGQLLGPFIKLFEDAGIPVPVTTPWGYGMIMTGMLLVSLAVMYFMTWILSAPVAIASVCAVVLAVTFARLVEVIAPVKAFVGFTILLFGIATFWQLWL